MITLSVVYIMWLRQIKRYWRSKSRIIGSIGQPLLFLLAFGFGMNSIYQQSQGQRYLDYLVPGAMAQAILMMAVFSGVELIWDQQFGFLKVSLAAPVSRLEIVLGRVLGGATIAFIQGIGVFIISLMFGFRPENWVLMPLIIVAMLLIGLVYSAIGTGIASMMKDFHGFQLIMNFLVMPTYFLSGALFPLQQTPILMQKIAMINPLTYGVEALRLLLTNQTTASLGNNFIILSLVSIIFLSISSYLFTKIET